MIPMNDRTMKKAALLFSLMTLMAFASIGQNSYFTAEELDVVPYPSFVYSLDDQGFSQALEASPLLSEETARNKGLRISLPEADGEVLDLEVFESPIMAKELADRFPHIKTYKVRGKGVTGRIGYTDQGFHGILFTAKGTQYIDPVEGVEGMYHTYKRKDFMAYNQGKKQHICLVEDHLEPLGSAFENSQRGQRTGDLLRTYRLALACTGEYAQYHGGTTSSVLSAMVVTMNRVNGVYEREFCITMEIIGNNDQIIFFNPSTDPYTNNSGFTMLGENQTTIDNIIGTVNYDIGHVFSTGGGGIASLGSVCSFSNKARGVTGGFNPVGDPFDIDYVAHEMGHQFRGNHTQNNECNRSAQTAWEPGSASTIMGYAGICAPNLQNNSDDYFHGGNYSEMRAFFQNGNGNSCAVISNTGNTPPVVTVDPTVYTIPMETPFVLRGSASDIDGDNLTYCWEQIDLGPSSPPDDPIGNAPMFRSFDPVDTNERTFPRLESVLNGNLVVGEIYPFYTRNLDFRLTVRDNNISGGGVAFDKVDVSVDSEKGPFVVTTPASLEEVQAGVSYAVEWDVAGTDESPVNCSAVHILLYSGFGFDLEDTLAANVPNDGSHNVIMPSNLGFGYRIRVEAADNIFFNYNPGNFFIVELEPLSNASIDLSLAPDWLNGAIDLEWNDPFNNENQWVLERSVGGNTNFTTLDTLPVNTTSYQDNQVNMFGTEYHYRVFAINPLGNSNYSNEASWLGVGMKELSSQFIKVYPNPATDLLNVEIENVTVKQASLRNIQGQVVRVLQDNMSSVAIEDLPAGTYFLEVQTKERGSLVTPVQVAR
jgi:hypothetical protein